MSSEKEDPSPLSVVYHTNPDFPTNPVELVDQDELDEIEQQSPLPISALRKTKTSDSVIQTLPFKELWIIIVGLSFAIFLSSLNQTIVATVLPIIASQFKSLDLVSWIATSYLLTSTVTQPVYGKLSDVFGRKILMLISTVLFLVGSALCAASVNMLMLIISRGVQGIGGGGLIALVQIIIGDTVSLRDRGTYTSFIGLIWTLSSVIGPLIGGVFADKLSWRWVFWINLPIGGLSLIIMLFFLRLPTETFWGTLKASDSVKWTTKLRRIDYLGTILLVLSTCGILLATGWGGAMFAWNSPVIIAVYASSGFLLICFVVVEVWVASDPIIPPHLFKVRNVTLVTVYSFSIGMAMFALIFYVPMYFQITRGNTATESGLQLLPLLISTIVFSIMCGVLITKTASYRIFVVLGAALVATGCGLISTWNPRTSNRGHEIGYMVIAGAGLGFTLQAAVIAAQAAIRHRDLAVTTSLVSFSRTIGGVIGLGLCGALFNNRASTLLTRNLSNLPGVTPQLITSLIKDSKAVTRLPAELVGPVIAAYTQSFQFIFILCVPVAGLAFLLSLGLKHHPMTRSTK